MLASGEILVDIADTGFRQCIFDIELPAGSYYAGVKVSEGFTIPLYGMAGNAVGPFMFTLESGVGNIHSVPALATNHIYADFPPDPFPAVADASLGYWYAESSQVPIIFCMWGNL